MYGDTWKHRALKCAGSDKEERMPEEIKVALIGLDTSHSIEFTRRMQAPDCDEDQKVEGMEALTCLRFETPFQDKDGLDKRQAQLEEWGVKVTEDFDEAIDGCDAIMLEINDPAYHLDYFKKVADLNRPIFLDKPLADTIENGRKICDIIKEKNLRVFSSSSLRYIPNLGEAMAEVPAPMYAAMYGPVGVAPAGSSIVWYGVHAFEMLERVMGIGAKSVFARKDESGVVVVVDYPEARRGIVELTTGVYSYGGLVRDKKKAFPFVADTKRLYTEELEKVVEFFRGGPPAASMEDALEIMAMLDAAEKSSQTGKTVKL